MVRGPCVIIFREKPTRPLFHLRVPSRELLTSPNRSSSLAYGRCDRRTRCRYDIRGEGFRLRVVRQRSCHPGTRLKFNWLFEPPWIPRHQISLQSRIIFLLNLGFALHRVSFRSSSRKAPFLQALLSPWQPQTFRHLYG